MTTTAVDLYLDLLMRSLTRSLQEDNDRILGFNDLPNCRAAVEACRARLGIDDELVRVDESAVYWRKSADTGA